MFAVAHLLRFATQAEANLSVIHERPDKSESMKSLGVGEDNKIGDTNRNLATRIALKPPQISETPNPTRNPLDPPSRPS